jgi:thymidylate synthase ThyX
MNINNKPNIFIPDHKQLNDPEVIAMIQAFYSRSDMPIQERLIDLNGGSTKLKEAKIKAAINQFYLNFGHASIGDCANVPVFIEGVSMLAAKALQDHPLYSGQERSTRYQDFSTVPFYTETSYSKDIAEKWRLLYKAYLPKIEEWVAKEYASRRGAILADDPPVDRTLTQTPEYTAKQDSLWYKTVKVIAFDIARGLLPCGATTSLSMYMSLRKFRDHLTELSTHPLNEVRMLAIQINDSLYSRYPNTFKPIRSIDQTKPAKQFYMARKVYGSVSQADIVDKVELGSSGQYLANEDDNTWFGIQGAIDFGSYRDLQRHRNGKNQMPFVNAMLGTINDYYAKILKAVDFDLYQQVLDNYDRLIGLSNLESGSIFELQYAHPMMTQVPTGNFWSKAQLKYVLALRSKTSVHPTLRDWCFSLYESLPVEERSEYEIDTRGHYEQSNRGNQDLKRRPETVQ